MTSPFKKAPLFASFHFKSSALLFLVLLFVSQPLVTAQTKSGINDYDDAGKTSLLRAVSTNNISEVKRLIELGADINKQEQYGLQGTPLMYATSIEDGIVLNLLIDNGADVNIVDVNEDPAINWAAYYGYTKNIEVLINNGADITLKSKHGDALDVVYRLWHPDSVFTVFKNSDYYKKIPDLDQNFIDMINQGNLDSVKQLLVSNTDPNTVDGLGMSALHRAIRTNNVAIASVLLEYDANPNILNRVGQTPLAIASRFNRYKLVQLLLDSGADPNSSGDKYKLTPLIGAAVNGDTTLIKTLLDAGADIDSQDVVNQATALHWSQWYENNNASLLLLNRGASYELLCLNDEYNAYTLALAINNTLIKRHIENLRSKEHSIIGSWKFSEIEFIYADTTYKVNPLQGNLLVSKGRYSIMYSPSSEPREAFESLSNPSDDEVLKAFKSIVFNSGYYELKDKVFIATPDIAKVPGFEGGKQYYSYSIDGETLKFKLFDETYPNGEKPEWYQKLEILFIMKRE